MVSPLETMAGDEHDGQNVLGSIYLIRRGEVLMIISCPSCRHKLRIPDSLSVLSFRCPLCQKVSYFDPEEAAPRPSSASNRNKSRRSALDRHKGIFWALVGIGVIAVIIITNQKTEVTPIRSTSRTASQQDLRNWIAIDYRSLLDGNAIIRTGDKLVNALGEPELKAAVQPHVDRFSYLLQNAVEAINGPDPYPYHDVVDHYPVGSKQPAWVAIFRGGRIAVTTDNFNHARVFLPGETPDASYKDHYSIVRHCLSGLLPEDGSPLFVEVYTYRHDYARSEFSLNDKPYIFKSTDFSPPSKTPLDLDGLVEFFSKDGELEGAQIDDGEGLILYAKAGGGRSTVAGQPLSLSDLAVAYRAVFHAGDNEAFISLDPHLDPTRVTVNFGGFLEDTRIGSVVLEADKRFKTIASGLDPNTYRDIRNYTRRFVPTFLAGNEREFLYSDRAPLSGWAGTRYWFYPDSIEVEADDSMRYGRVARPRFTADAERSRDDFLSPQEFEGKKRNSLSPSIRECIDQINASYPNYEQAYKEISELTTVARLMGICSWLKKAEYWQADLDALLSVELPAFRTERERTQMISVATLAYSDVGNLSPDYVKRNSRVTNLSPILDMTVGEYFKNSQNLEKYLSLKTTSGTTSFLEYRGTRDQWEACRLKAVRSMIRTEEDLKELATYAADRIKAQSAEEVQLENNRLAAMKANLQDNERELDRLERSADLAPSTALANYYINQYNALVARHERQRQAYNAQVEYFNGLAPSTVSKFVRISGGINLEPRSFRITKAPQSPTLKSFVTMAAAARIDQETFKDGGAYFRSRTGRGVPVRTMLPRHPWEAKDQFTADGANYVYSVSGRSGSYWTSVNKQLGSWRTSAVNGDGSYSEKSLTGSKLVVCQVDKRARQVKAIVGERVGPNRIVFRPAADADKPAHAKPPAWWIGH